MKIREIIPSPIPKGLNPPAQGRPIQRGLPWVAALEKINPERGCISLLFPGSAQPANMQPANMQPTHMQPAHMRAIPMLFHLASPLLFPLCRGPSKPDRRPFPTRASHILAAPKGRNITAQGKASLRASPWEKRVLLSSPVRAAERSQRFPDSLAPRSGDGRARLCRAVTSFGAGKRAHLGTAPMQACGSLAPRSGERVRERGSFLPTGAVPRRASWGLGQRNVTARQSLARPLFSKFHMNTRYTILIERGPKNFSSYAPDFPGCVAAAATEQETLALMKEALEMHIEDMRERGEPIPQPSTMREIEIAA